MLKKIFSLFFALMIFMSGSAFAAVDLKAFADISAKNAASGALLNSLQNNLHFSHDYSILITDVCKNFINDISALASSYNSGSENTGFQKAVKKAVIYQGIFFQNITEKKFYRGKSFFNLQDIESSEAVNTIFLLIVLTFMLWYIGLLRLFSGNAFFKKQIEI